MSITAFTQDLYPLAVGNTWSYNVQHMQGDTVFQSYTTENKVRSSYVFNDTTVYVLYEIDYDFHVINVNGENIEFDTAHTERPVVFHDYKKYKGKSYTPYKYTPIDVAKKASKIETPLGTFKAYKYMFYDVDFTEESKVSDYYIVKGIGAVKIVVYKSGSLSNRSEYTLFKYTLL